MPIHRYSRRARDMIPSLGYGDRAEFKLVVCVRSAERDISFVTTEVGGLSCAESKYELYQSLARKYIYNGGDECV